MIDKFSLQAECVSNPSRFAYPVTLSDTIELPRLPRSIRIGTVPNGGGTVKLRSVDGTEDVTYTNVAAGENIDVRAQYIRATGTTATNIVAHA